MKNLIICIFYIGLSPFGWGQMQSDSTWKLAYREKDQKINDLVHTRLRVRFDYAKAYLYGEVSITLKPHFYPTDSLNLDAKQMSIDQVGLEKGNRIIKLNYLYDGWNLRIRLDKIYKAFEKYTVYIRYTAKPNEAKVTADAKGLYFINPKGDQKDKPTQIWTDGETEKTSMWCPTIDRPNQKTTEEIILTVPEKYVTLSNGKLISQNKNKDGTRTDHWKMDLPHAPYLFFMGVGDFAIVKDFYKGIEVSYYVEREYSGVARRIFGQTPAMIAFFEKITGIPFPWVKYSQIALRDFTSTAMENTTATAHMSEAQQDARELVDGNRWENNIAHELFHQWFGDYVTCASWSNLTLNESFARYSEYLWQEFQYGADAAGEENYNQFRNYFSNPTNEEKALVRYYYADKEDLFDDISYGKGSLILNMLRNYIGDSAFFTGLNRYLTVNKFKSAEVHQLRLAMEEVSGQDLNWFFNQWYFGYGHPKVTINYDYDSADKKLMVFIDQTQGRTRLFKIPVTIDIYCRGEKTSHLVWLKNEKDSFSFSCTGRPDLVNVDPGKSILWEKKDNKTIEEFIYQYRFAGNYMDRREAIAACARHPENPLALDLLKQGLKDKYAGIRQFTLFGLNIKNDTIMEAIKTILPDLAKFDKNAYVRRIAIRMLANYPGKKYLDIIRNGLIDSSYSVAGESLNALGRLDSSAALNEAKRLVNEKTKGTLAEEIVGALAEFGSEEDFDLIADKYSELTFKPRITRNFGHYLARLQSTEKLKKGVDIIVHFRETILSVYTTFINRDILGVLLSKKQAAGLNDQAEYIKSKLPETTQKQTVP
jgi:aminopeptidase N